MTTIFTILFVQALLGAFDNLWHHELEAKLPQRPTARRELALHAARELIYGTLFIGLAWFEWRGAWAAWLGALLLAEVGITLADFLEEDCTRRLPPLERGLHTVLAVGYGVFLAAFAPILWAWGQSASSLMPVAYGAVSWAFSLFGGVVIAWGLRNATAVRQLSRSRPGQALAAAQAPVPSVPPTVLVTGATGFVGSALVAGLLRDGHRVIVLTRDRLLARSLWSHSVWAVDTLADIPSETRIDAVVNLAGARVLGMPWTQRRRQELLASRVDVTAAVIALMRRLQQRPAVMVSASAVGYYGAVEPTRYGQPLDEDAAPQPGQFQSDLCIAIEHEARRAEALGVRVVRLRLGVVLGRGGGAYPALALAARCGLGAILGDGQQPMPWIHLADAVGLIRFAMANRKLAGPMNAVAPQVCTQAEFTRTSAASFHRRAWLHAPAAPMRWLMGEMSDLLLRGQPVQPRVALAAGYRFQHGELLAACASLAGATPRGGQTCQSAA
jgi:uncharacterized protein